MHNLLNSLRVLYPARTARVVHLAVAVFALVVGARWTATASAQEVPLTGEAAIRAHISYLASPELKGRAGRSKQLARDYIIREFVRSGVRPFFNGEWIQPVPGQVGLDGELGPVGENIGGCVIGTDPVLKDEWIIINAHYDHLGVLGGEVHPGADDNASGTSMLLEVARTIAARPLKRSVAFVAFDFEETLLWGSRWFIGHTPVDLQQIKLSITADMIGRSLGGMDLPTVFLLGAEHSSLIRETIEKTQVPDGLELAQLGTDMIGTRSDYGPFRDQQIPFLFFSTGEHPDYHRPSDTPDKIDYAKTTRIILLITELVTKLGNGEQPIVWEDPVYQKVEEARAVHQITSHLMKADEDGRFKLTFTQRFFVSQVQSKTGFMVRKGKVSDDERKWVGRTALILLVAVF
ncbi:M28 family peptidase [Planctomicrobium sp. SH668]|uniref:M28 family peptidase n=1 Tax=Planctomicrobium sp. SH668 TaxID=3448126 RepID=UPI003F5BEACF